ncbi:MAG TPA: transcription antitermination factor NusB [Candidatus Paceibacterota bacterium]|nr:transcription antitermination factor NusB [Candidatus Paceibacterota bacterium]
MAHRHLARSVVLQALFEGDIRKYSEKEIGAVIKRDISEFAPESDAGDLSFIEALGKNVLKKQPELDEIISKAAPDWPLDKISIVDRNILRIGLYELLFSDKNDVPPKVAINEAIELAKGYGGENSGKFVNGVLGSVYKELGEPGKDAVSKRRENKFNLPLEKMPIEHKGGAVIYAKTPDGLKFAFVHDVFGHWTLSKGGIEGADPEEGTVKKIKQEIGLDIKIKEKLAENEYVATHPEKGKIRKQVTYFLAEAKHVPLELAKSGGLDNAKWFSMQEIAELNFYNDIFPIVTKAIQILTAEGHRPEGSGSRKKA